MIEALLILLILLVGIVGVTIYRAVAAGIPSRPLLPNMKTGDRAVAVKLQPVEPHGMTEVDPEDIAAIVAAEETLEAHFEYPSRTIILDSIDYLNGLAASLAYPLMEADLNLSDDALNQARLDYQADLLAHREMEWESRPDRKTPAELKIGESIWLSPDCFVRSNLPIHDYSIGVYKRISGFVAPHGENQIEVRMTEDGLVVWPSPVMPTEIAKAANDSKFVLPVKTPSAWLKVAWNPETDPSSVQLYKRWSEENGVMDELSIGRHEARNLIRAATGQGRPAAEVWREEGVYMTAHECSRIDARLAVADRYATRVVGKEHV